MGLDQWILRNKDGETPDIVDGEWVNATECIQLRKEYWLRNALNPYVKETFGKDIVEMCGEFIPIPKEVLEEVIMDTKKCVHNKDEIEVMQTFKLLMFYSNHDFDWCIAGMSYFNQVMVNRLRSKKENCYWYVESW